MVVIAFVWTTETWIPTPGRMPIPFPGLRTAWTVWLVRSGSALLISVPVTGRSSWRRRTGTRQPSAPAVGCISSRSWALGCAMHLLPSRGLWRLSWGACNGRSAWCTWMTSSFLGGHLTRLWAAYPVSLTASRTLASSWTQRSVPSSRRRWSFLGTLWLQKGWELIQRR